MSEYVKTFVPIIEAILAGIYLIFIVVAFGKIVSVKNNFSKSDFLISSNQLLSFFCLLFLFFLINIILVYEKPHFFSSSGYIDMVAIQFYLISTMLNLILMKEIGLLKGISYCYTVFVTISILTILIIDFFYFRFSRNQPIVLMRIFSVVINTMVYLFFAIKIHKEHIRSPFFTSKGRVLEISLIASYNLLLNYASKCYLISNNKYSAFTIMILVGLLSQLLAAHRILWKKSPYIEAIESENAIRNLPSLETSNLSKGEADIQKRLLDYFENEKPYLSPNVSLNEVALRMFTNKSYVSKIINLNMNKNFRELVNYYRIRDAMKYYVANNQLSIAELCKMSGFRNNASFTNAFKINTGFTPGEWCRQLKNKNGNADDTL